MPDHDIELRRLERDLEQAESDAFTGKPANLAGRIALAMNLTLEREHYALCSPVLEKGFRRDLTLFEPDVYGAAWAFRFVDSEMVWRMPIQ